MIYYNKALFKAQKAAPILYRLLSQRQLDLEAFRKVAKAMTIVEAARSRRRALRPGISVFVLASGGNILKEQNRTYVSDLQNPATARGMNFLRDLYMDGSF